MLNSFILPLLFLLWVARAISATLSSLWWWQKKEYRWDRFWAAWKEGEGRGLLFSRLWKFRWLIIVAFFLFGFLWLDSLYAVYALIFLYSAELIWFGIKLWNRTLLFPRFSARLFIIFLGAMTVFLGIGLYILFTRNPAHYYQISSPIGKGGLSFEIKYLRIPLLLLCLDLLNPFIVSFFVLFSAVPVGFAKRRIIAQAKQARLQHPELMVAGITGSFGKTSTKEFAAQLLSEHFTPLQPGSSGLQAGEEGKVLEKARQKPRPLGRVVTGFTVFKTLEHENNEIAVARRFLYVCSQLKAKSYKLPAIFLAEMGAYRKGEIQLLTGFLKPNIGILTGLSDQHLALFGSRESILDAKWELVSSLPADGTLIFNADIQAFRERVKSFSGRVISYGLHESAVVRATDIREKKAGIDATINIGAEELAVSVPLLGTFQISNVLAAVGLAHSLGISLDEIASSISGLKSLPKTMEPHLGPNGSIIIDDSYSANPEGAIAAIGFLRNFSGNKIVVFPSLIELGAASDAAHRRIGKAIGDLAVDLAICTDERAKRQLQEGTRVANKIVFSSDSKRIIELIKPLLGDDSALLIEGRIPQQLYNALSKNLLV